MLDESAWPFHQQIMETFPFNKYSIEPCELTEYLSTHRGLRWKVCILPSVASPLSQQASKLNRIALQAYIRIEGNEHTGGHRYAPFGFLQASGSGQGRRVVHLFVLPFDFPRLWPLLGSVASAQLCLTECLLTLLSCLAALVADLAGPLKYQPTLKWRQDFESYLASVPSYYLPLLRNGTYSLSPSLPLSLIYAFHSSLRGRERRASILIYTTAMKRFGVMTTVIPDHLDGGLSYTLSNSMKKLKQHVRP